MQRVFKERFGPFTKKVLLVLAVLWAIVALANRAASITTSRHGAIPAMPTLEEVLS